MAAMTSGANWQLSLQLFILFMISEYPMNVSERYRKVSEGKHIPYIQDIAYFFQVLDKQEATQ